MGALAYYNYKSFNSIVLVASCDAWYCFTFTDIGDVGCTNDASILSKSLFGQEFENSPTEMQIPSLSLHGQTTLPYFVVGDDNSSPKPWLMKPYPGRNLKEHLVIHLMQ